MRHARSVFGSRAAGRRGACAGRRRAPALAAHARPASAPALRRRGQGEGQRAQVAGHRASATTRHDRHGPLRIGSSAK